MIVRGCGGTEEPPLPASLFSILLPRLPRRTRQGQAFHKAARAPFPTARYVASVQPCGNSYEMVNSSKDGKGKRGKTIRLKTFPTFFLSLSPWEVQES